MARHKSSKGITPKTINKLEQVITCMIAGMRPDQEAKLAEIGGFNLRDAVKTGVYRWRVKQQLASQLYELCLEVLRNHGYEFNYFERGLIRAMVQTVVMKALRHAESGQPIPWNAVERDVRMYNRLKWGLPDEVVTLVLDTCRKGIEEGVEIVQQAIKYGVYAEVRLAPQGE